MTYTRGLVLTLILWPIKNPLNYNVLIPYVIWPTIHCRLNHFFISWNQLDRFPIAIDRAPRGVSFGNILNLAAVATRSTANGVVDDSPRPVVVGTRCTTHGIVNDFPRPAVGEGDKSRAASFEDILHLSDVTASSAAFGISSRRWPVPRRRSRRRRTTFFRTRNCRP